MKTILIVLGGLLGAAVFSYLVFGNPDASIPIPRPGENAAPAAAASLILLIWLGTGAIYAVIRFLRWLAPRSEAIWTVLGRISIILGIITSAITLFQLSRH